MNLALALTMLCLAILSIYTFMLEKRVSKLEKEIKELKKWVPWLLVILKNLKMEVIIFLAWYQQ